MSNPPQSASALRSIRTASRAFVRELGFLSEPRGRNFSNLECHLLIELDLLGEASGRELAELLLVDKSQISRAVATLTRKGCLGASLDKADSRRKLLRLTQAGRRNLEQIHRGADEHVASALGLLKTEQQWALADSLALYAKALQRARRTRGLTTRLATPADDDQLKRLIHTVMPEFGAEGPGFAIEDPEVMAMSRAYRKPRHLYLVVARGSDIVGAGGYAPLEGGAEGTCELRKMYFKKEVRGLGVGKALLERLMADAKAAGFQRMYLETLQSMTEAQSLYRAMGFRPLTKRKGRTGHFGCNAFFERAL